MTKPSLLGDVDLLGLNQFGENPGMNPLWGMVIGGSVSGITSTALSRTGGTASRHADLIGFLAGLASGGALYSMKSTRHAAFGAFAGAFFAAGLKWLEGILFGSPAVTPKPVAGMGLPMINPLNGLGLPMINSLNGLGLPSISQNIPPQGAIPGVAGPQVSGQFGANMPPVNLLGQQMSAGGPQVSGLSARYGATLMSRT
jgi:hypothetical protein